MRKPYSTRANQWRRENPNDLKQWPTKYGHVSQFWGFRVYCGRCKDCEAPVTTRRDVSAYNWGETRIGRWPALCAECQSAKTEKHSEEARYRMQRLRRERAALQAAQFKAHGLPAPKPGILLGYSGRAADGTWIK